VNLECATCHRPLPDAPAPAHIGGIRFCCAECVKEWRISHPVNVVNGRRWFA
jgi:hypothetical protein